MMLSLLVAAVVSQSPPQARWPVEPVVGAAFAVTQRALTVSGGATGTALHPGGAVSSLVAGVRYAAWADRLWVHSAALVGVESLNLHLVLGLQQQVLYRVALTSWFGLRAGLGLAASLDTVQPTFSAATISAVLGFEVWRFELLWSPGLQLPLGNSSTDVADARVSQGAALGVMPLSFALRVAFGP